MRLKLLGFFSRFNVLDHPIIRRLHTPIRPFSPLYDR